MLCTAQNTSVTGNFAHKTEAYANRQNEGVALPEEERIGQVGASSDYGADNLRANDSSIQLQAVVRPQVVECSWEQAERQELWSCGNEWQVGALASLGAVGLC